MVSSTPLQTLLRGACKEINRDLCPGREASAGLPRPATSEDSEQETCRAIYERCWLGRCRRGTDPQGEMDWRLARRQHVPESVVAMLQENRGGRDGDGGDGRYYPHGLLGLLLLIFYDNPPG